MFMRTIKSDGSVSMALIVRGEIAQALGLRLLGDRNNLVTRGEYIHTNSERISYLRSKLYNFHI
jgi:hypothetical protein